MLVALVIELVLTEFLLLLVQLLMTMPLTQGQEDLFLLVLVGQAESTPTLIKIGSVFA